MVVLLRAAVDVLLLAHGLVHLLYFAPGVPEFSLDRAWLVPEPARRPLGTALAVATVAGFTLVGLAAWDVPGLSAVWPVLAVAAGVVSAVLLITFWSNALVLGIGIDVAAVLTAVLHPAWADRFVGG